MKIGLDWREIGQNIHNTYCTVRLNIIYVLTNNTFCARYDHNGEFIQSPTNSSIEKLYKWLNKEYQECLKENYEKFIKKPMKPLQMFKDHLSNYYGDCVLRLF